MKTMISIIAITGIIYFLYFKNEPVKEVNFKPNRNFGIMMHNNIYEETIDLKLYTSRGRLKQTKQKKNEY